MAPQTLLRRSATLLLSICLLADPALSNALIPLPLLSHPQPLFTQEAMAISGSALFSPNRHFATKAARSVDELTVERRVLFEPLFEALAHDGHAALSDDQGHTFSFTYTRDVSFFSRHRHRLAVRDQQGEVGFLHFTVDKKHRRAVMEEAFDGLGHDVAIYVDEEYRSRHIASTLVGIAMRIAIREGANDFYALRVSAESAPFYEQMGFIDMASSSIMSLLLRKLERKSWKEIPFASSDYRYAMKWMDQISPLPALTVRSPARPQGRTSPTQTHGLSEEEAATRDRKIDEILEDLHAPTNHDHPTHARAAQMLEQDVLALSRFTDELLTRFEALAHEMAYAPGAVRLYLVGGRAKKQAIWRESDLDFVLDVDMFPSKEVSSRLISALRQASGDIAERLGVPHRFHILGLASPDLEGPAILLGKNERLDTLDRVLRKNNVAVQDVQRFIYPAAGSDRDMVLAILNFFPNISEAHLISLGYKLDPHQYASVQAWAKDIELEFARKGRTVKIHVIAQNFYDTRLPPSRGRTLLLDKFFGTNSQHQREPAYHQAIARNTSSGDIIVSLPTPGATLPFKHRMASQTRIPGYANWSNFDVFRKVKEDDDLLSQGEEVAAQTSLSEAIEEAYRIRYEELDETMEFPSNRVKEFRSTAVGVFSPTPIRPLIRLFQRLGVKPGMHVIDAGGGDGRVAIAAAGAFGATALSIEASATLHGLAQEMQKRLSHVPGVGRVSLVHGRIEHYDLSRADLVYYTFNEPPGEDPEEGPALDDRSNFRRIEKQLADQLEAGSLVLLTMYQGHKAFEDPRLEEVSLEDKDPDVAFLRPRLYRRRVVAPQRPHVNPRILTSA